MISQDEVFSKQVETLAAQYKEKSLNELNELFQEEWWMATPRQDASTHRDNKFWDAFKKRLVAEILKNRDAGSATLGFLTSQVLNEVQGYGIDLVAYKIPIAILVAIIARSVWDTLEKK